jgi:GT2 family glycosyltransferase
MKVGVVLLNWENARCTLDALNSLVGANPRPERVVVVDNASGDDSIARLEAWADARGIPRETVSAGTRTNGLGPWLTVMVAPSNRGFAIGNNFGIRYLLRDADLSHVLLLNNDATVRADFLAELRGALERVPDAGLVTGTIFVDSGERSEVWYAGGREIPLRGLTAHVTTLPADDQIRDTEFVSGCAMLISRDVLEDVGLLSECYEPFYGEDAEYSYRTRRAGFPVVYAPRVTVFHKVGGTIGPARSSPNVTYSQVRHRLFYIRRNFTGMTKAIALTYTVGTKPVRALLETLSGRPLIGLAVLRGTLAGLLHRAGE